jgi:hypothetical protein
MINYIWKIARVEVKAESGMENIIQTVYWHKMGVDIDGDIGDFFGNTILPTPSTGSFINFNQLTEEQVVEWVIQSIDVDYHNRVNKYIERSIKKKKNRIKEIPDTELPWNINNQV